LLPGTVFTFGRSRQNAVHLEDALVSRQHAGISCDYDGKVHVMDLNSSNKTYVNDEELEPKLKVELRHNDKIRMGGTVFYLVKKTAEPATGKESRRLASKFLEAESTSQARLAAEIEDPRATRRFSGRSTAILAPVRDLPNEDAPALSGQLKVQGLPQILQFLHHNANTGELRVTSTDCQGTLLFDKGVIFSARADAETGSEAIYMLALLREGSFSFVASDQRPAGEANVEDDMMHVIFECCRRVDEASKSNPAS
jgi:pSer/pThr/pTyr-binding forkhead associated (FHA) protein